jgi:hypothetical protein
MNGEALKARQLGPGLLLPWLTTLPSAIVLAYSASWLTA